MVECNIKKLLVYVTWGSYDFKNCLLQGTQLSQVIKLKTEECNVCNYFERHDIEFAPTRKKCNY